MSALRRVLGLVAAGLACALALAGPAAALPGDPPPALLSPADGASVPARAISVAFACPEYRKEVLVAGEQQVPIYGDSSDYAVRFSASADLDANGRLRDSELGSVQAFPRDGTCSGDFQGAGGPSDPSVGGGRVYWQAARTCSGCATGYETSLVGSFLARAGVTATLRTPARLYQGYLGVFTVRSTEAIPGARVRLERRAGNRWRPLTEEPFHAGDTTLVAKLPTGRQQLRAVILAGAARFPLTAQKLTVRRAGSRFPSRQDGSYRDRKAARDSPLSFSLRRGAIRGFKAPVAAFCAGLNPEDNTVTILVARFGPVRVAPDGGVVGVVRINGAREVLSGRVSRGRLVGSVDVRLPRCAGTRRFTATRG